MNRCPENLFLLWSTLGRVLYVCCCEGIWQRWDPLLRRVCNNPHAANCNQLFQAPSTKCGLRSHLRLKAAEAASELHPAELCEEQAPACEGLQVMQPGTLGCCWQAPFPAVLSCLSVSAFSFHACTATAAYWSLGLPAASPVCWPRAGDLQCCLKSSRWVHLGVSHYRHYKKLILCSLLRQPVHVWLLQNVL